jgi:hypothetical protein
LPRALRSAQTGHDSLLSENSVLQTGQARLSFAITAQSAFRSNQSVFRNRPA